MGGYLPKPVFTPVQYLAISRVTSRKDLKILILDEEKNYTHQQPIYWEVFDNIYLLFNLILYYDLWFTAYYNLIDWLSKVYLIFYEPLNKFLILWICRILFTTWKHGQSSKSTFWYPIFWVGFSFYEFIEFCARLESMDNRVNQNFWYSKFYKYFFIIHVQNFFLFSLQVFTQIFKVFILLQILIPLKVILFRCIEDVLESYNFILITKLLKQPIWYLEIWT